MNSSDKSTKPSRWFLGVSWGVTALVVVPLLGFILWRAFPRHVSAAAQATPTEGVAPAALPATASRGNGTQAIVRHVLLKTQLDQTINYKVRPYTVRRGDSVFGIADLFKVKPETVFWANYDAFNGSPDSLKPGQISNIPPTDGVLYQWQEGDTIDSVAEEFDLDPAVILNWPGNAIDLTNPEIPPDAYVMLPGAEKNDQPLFIETATVASSSGSGSTGMTCFTTYASRGYFGWPAPNHYLSGYDYGANGHRGIDIAAVEGTPIYAADNGVVTMAAAGWNYGYGNVIQIDHGNGFVTLYAHLSAIYVNVCEPISAGSVIGAAGDTGNSFGAHLHFEVRYGGATISPWNVLPPP